MVNVSDQFFQLTIIELIRITIMFIIFLMTSLTNKRTRCLRRATQLSRFFYVFGLILLFMRFYRFSFQSTAICMCQTQKYFFNNCYFTSSEFNQYHCYNGHFANRSEWADKIDILKDLHDDIYYGRILCMNDRYTRSLDDAYQHKQLSGKISQSNVDNIYFTL